MSQLSNYIENKGRTFSKLTTSELFRYFLLLPAVLRSFTCAVSVWCKYYMVRIFCSSLPNPMFSDTTLVVVLGRGESIYIMEMGRC